MRGVMGTAGLEFALGGFTAGGGALFGSGLGGTAGAGEYLTASYAAYSNPGIFKLKHTAPSEYGESYQFTKGHEIKP